MKGFCLALCLIAVIGVCCFADFNGGDSAKYLRIHIRADSNDTVDQNVKYAVKSAVCDYLTPYIAEVESKQQAMQIILGLLDKIEQVADEVLAVQGLPYRASASVKEEEFPCRSYDNMTLSQGVYDALVVKLGSGKGDNWWCVIYPPLCFVGAQPNGTNEIVYRSKLLELIRGFQQKSK